MEIKNALDEAYRHALTKFASKGIRPRVEALIFNCQGQVLVGKKDGKYKFPGGGIEQGESPIEAAKREIHEEAGKNVTQLDILERKPYILRAPTGYKSSTVFVTGRLIGGPQASNFGAEGDKLPDLHWADPHKVQKNLFDLKEDPNDISGKHRGKVVGKAIEKQAELDTEFVDPADEAESILRMEGKQYTFIDPAEFPDIEIATPPKDEDGPIILVGPAREDDDDEPWKVMEYVQQEGINAVLEKEASYGIIKEGSAIIASAGQLLVNSELPPELRDHNRVFNKKSMGQVMQQIAQKYPEKYTDTVMRLKRLGDREATFSAEPMKYSDLVNPVNKEKYFMEARKKVQENLKKGLSQEHALIDAYGEIKNKLNQDVLLAGAERNNSLANMAISGSRGKPAQITDMIATPMMVSDFKNRPISLIIKNSYADGLTPAEYWAASYGTRRGLISTKMAVPKAGYMNKMFSWSNANTVVVEEDCKTDTGVMYDVNDKHNIGRRLARNEGKHSKDSMITGKVLDDLIASGVKRIMVRSPMTCEARSGICKKCVGTVETGRPPEVGYNVGMNSAAAMTEPLQQGMLSEKHTGGAIKARVGGYPLIKQLVEVPKVFPQKATVSEEHGRVEKIEKAPWGGNFVYVNDKKHYIPEGYDLKVKTGDTVEKGLPLSEGIVNPSDVTRLRGIGEGRKQLMSSLQSAYKEMGHDLDRLHFEIAAKSFVNFGRVSGSSKVGDYLPGDVAHFSSLQKTMKFDNIERVPIRKGQRVPAGRFLAKPAIHYTVGTEITPKILDDLHSNGIKEIMVTPDKPQFTPLMVRIQDTAMADSDWVQRLYSQGLKKSLETGVHRAHKSSIVGPSFVHPYAYGAKFGRDPDKGKY